MPPPTPDCPPGFSMSEGDIESDSGCRLGAPCVDAFANSTFGPFEIKSNGRFTMLLCGLGVFCSAVIHARELGSGCGMGAPKDFNLSFAPGTMLDNG